MIFIIILAAVASAFLKSKIVAFIILESFTEELDFGMATDPVAEAFQKMEPNKTGCCGKGDSGFGSIYEFHYL